MSETRRDLFKTSVLSGLGLMSASALAGCAGAPGVDGHHPFVDATGYVAGIGPNSQWYLFVLNSTATAYRVSVLKLGSPFTPKQDPSTSKAFFDVRAWSNLAQADFTDAPGGTVMVGGKPIKILSNHETDAGATVVLRGCIPMSWNEIAL